MRVYNTLTRRLEEFKPLTPGKILFYHCGPTVYWVQHIGNLRAMVWADLIRRSLMYLGYTVKFVRNYTDVGHLVSDEDVGEDKMDKGAKREGLNPKEIADKYIAIFENDLRNLNTLSPDMMPRATEYIPQIIAMVKTLIDKGYAYITDQAVVYDVSKFKAYNELNHQKLELNIKGAGQGKVEDPQKKHPADFNLWVFKKGIHANALQTWSSPWGEGFPGWHIECSVMVKELLGETIDIHMGGIEHVPVHHTNEIAQSEAANGVKFVNYWLHNEHLIVDNQKMAKSTGTGFTLAEIKKNGFHPLALRYLFLQAHYRSKQNFTWEGLSAAAEGLKNMREMVISLRKQTQRTTLSEEKLNELNAFRSRFKESLSNDFQIPQALATAWEMLKSNIPSPDKLDLMLDFDGVLGLKLNESTVQPIPPEVIDLAKLRDEARKNKDFQKSDELRRKIEEKGYRVEDTSAGTVVKK